MMKGRRLYPPEFMPPALINVNRVDPQSGRETHGSPARRSPNRHGLGPAAGAFDQAQAQQIAAVLSRPTPDHQGQSAHRGLSVEVLKADLQKRTIDFGPMNDRAQARCGFVPGQPDQSLLEAGVAGIVAVLEATDHAFSVFRSVGPGTFEARSNRGGARPVRRLDGNAFI